MHQPEEVQNASNLTITNFTASPEQVNFAGTLYINVSISGGSGVIVYAYTGLPTDCFSSDHPEIECVPTSAGNFLLRVYVNDSAGQQATATASMAVFTVLNGVNMITNVSYLLTNSSMVLSAETYCEEGACPVTQFTYNWTLNNSLGVLLDAHSSNATFLAGNAAGWVEVVLNVTYHGQSLDGIQDFQILPRSLERPVNLTITPVAPVVAVDSEIEITTHLTCVPKACNTTGASAPVYNWGLSGCCFASLDPSPNGSSAYLYGEQVGNLTVELYAYVGPFSLYDLANIMVTPDTTVVLEGIQIQETENTLPVGGTVSLEAVPFCEPSGCDALAIAYTWAVGNDLGSLSAVSGPSTVFTAGDQSGVAQVSVVAQYNGTQVTAYTLLTIEGHTIPVTYVPSVVTGTDWWLVAAVVIVVVVGTAGTALQKRRPPETPPTMPPTALMMMPPPRPMPSMRPPPPGHAWEITEGEDEPIG